MKIALTGKGGVGKTTISSILCHIYSLEGKKVIAVDADPDANLASALGVPREESDRIRAIGELPQLIEERTGAKPGSSGGVFKLNPRVDDIPDGFGYQIDGITLLVMGKSKTAASGCYCPENTLLRRLLKHLLLERDEVVIVDMEAGIEHLTRGTTEGVDAFIVVVEPGQRSIQTAVTVRNLARDIGIETVSVIANKVRNEDDVGFIKSRLGDIHYLGELHFNNDIMEADVKGEPVFRDSPTVVGEVKKIKKNLEKLI